MGTRKLPWLIALVFSVVLLVQYIELPYGYVLSSLLSFGKTQAVSSGSFLAGGSSNDTGHPENEFLNATNFADGENITTLKPDLKSELNELSNDTSGISKNTVADYPSQDFPRMNHSATDETFADNKTLMPRSRVYVLPVSSGSSAKNSSSDNLGGTNTTFPPPNLASHVSSPDYMSIKQHSHAESGNLGMDSKGKDAGNMVLNNSKSAGSVINSPGIKSQAKPRWKGPPSVVVPISAMNDMLRQSRTSYLPLKPRWPSPADKELLNAHTLIESANIVEKSLQIDVDVYRNYSIFMRSYKLMEETLKIYVYAEGKRPIFHQPELHGIYASEGWFMKQLEESKHFVTKRGKKAHLFYLPFSSRVLQETLYVKYSHSRKNLVAFLSAYLQNITTAYPFWKRTSGADHFLVACHDWAPAETKRIMSNCIRALCNADVRGGLQFGRDVSLPEIYVHDASDPLKGRGGKPPSQRHILAFFAGNMHGYFRPILLNYWQDKDPDMKIFGKLQPGKGQMTYTQYMKSSKYCISAKGYEAYSPRVMEAIFYECVPVIISDNYVPPFFETLNWESFAVFILEKDTPNLKRILESIPEKKYRKMQERVRQVQKHFLWHKTPVKYDVFHMILHSIWYTRVLQMRP